MRLYWWRLPGSVPGQAAQRHQPRHETEIGVRFAGPDKLVHLIGLGEVVQAWGEASRIFCTGTNRLVYAA